MDLTRQLPVEVIRSIQLGIESSAKSGAQQERIQLIEESFTDFEALFFASVGSSYTPAHNYPEFYFETVAPLPFQYLRDIYGLHYLDYVASISRYPLKTRFSSIYEGNAYYLSWDEEFRVMIMSEKEESNFRKNDFLLTYYSYVSTENRTLLPRIFGVYIYLRADEKLRIFIVIYDNPFPRSMDIRERYLVGAGEFNMRPKFLKMYNKLQDEWESEKELLQKHKGGFTLPHSFVNSFWEVLGRDTKFLRKLGFRNYGLLLGVHKVTSSKVQWMPTVDEDDDLTSTLSIPSEVAQDVSRVEDGREMQKSQTSGNSFSRMEISSMRKSTLNVKKRVYRESNPLDVVCRGKAVRFETVHHNIVAGLPARGAGGTKFWLYIGLANVLSSPIYKKGRMESRDYQSSFLESVGFLFQSPSFIIEDTTKLKRQTRRSFMGDQFEDDEFTILEEPPFESPEPVDAPNTVSPDQMPSIRITELLLKSEDTGVIRSVCNYFTPWI